MGDLAMLRVGCPQWADRRWVGRHFPSDTPPGRELAAYATWCRAVEGNTTFYGLPSATTVTRWADDAPADFRFVFKLPRTVTHERRLRNAETDVATFLDRLAPLGHRASPHSIQLPAAFGPDDLGALATFLRRLPRQEDQRWAVEVRHRRFCDGGPDERRLNELLARHGAERIVLDTRAVFAGPRRTPAEREAVERKPQLPVRPVAIGSTPVVRFIGQTDAGANPRWWAKWVPKLAHWLDEGRTPIVFVHTPDNEDSPALARQLHDEVARAYRARTGRSLEPLPEPAVAGSQLRLL